MRRLNKIIPLILRTNIPRLVILFAVVLTVSSVTAQHSSDSGAVLTVQWNNKCNMPGPLYAFNAATLGNKIYAIGGRGKEERHDRYAYVYDAVKDSWEVKKEPMFPRSNHAVTALGDKIYVFGGNDSPNKAEVYDPGADSWKELAPIPSPRMHINYSATVYDGKIFLIGGLEKRGGPYYDADSRKNEMYDPMNNTWTAKAPLPSPRQTAAVIAFGKHIYVISGKERYDDRNDVFVYDPEADTWLTKAPMPETRFISGAAVVKDKIIVITGVDGRGCRESKIFVYEPLKDRWQDLGKVPRSFMLAGVASVGEKFYVLGGSDLDNILFQCLEGTIVLKEGIGDEQLVKQITKDPANACHVKWSPDGKTIAFSSDGAGNTDIWVKDVK